MGRIPDCGHGVKQELPHHRGVRIWEMNCGEVACSLSMHDFFHPDFIREWIDGALENKIDGWKALDRSALKSAQALRLSA